MSCSYTEYTAVSPTSETFIVENVNLRDRKSDSKQRAILEYTTFQPTTEKLCYSALFIHEKVGSPLVTRSGRVQVMTRLHL